MSTSSQSDCSISASFLFRETSSGWSRSNYLNYSNTEAPTPSSWSRGSATGNTGVSPSGVSFNLISPPSSPPSSRWGYRTNFLLSDEEETDSESSVEETTSSMAVNIRYPGIETRRRLHHQHVMSEDDPRRDINSEDYKTEVVRNLLANFDLEKTMDRYRNLSTVEYKIQPKDYSLDR